MCSHVEQMRVVWKRLIDSNDRTRRPPLRFALSGDKVVTITGTVSTNNGQGLEVGYSNTGSALLRPDATATGCLLVGNAHGARYGDNYDWTYRGKLDIGSSLILVKPRIGAPIRSGP